MGEEKTESIYIHTDGDAAAVEELAPDVELRGCGPAKVLHEAQLEHLVVSLRALSAREGS